MITLSTKWFVKVCTCDETGVKICSMRPADEGESNYVEESGGHTVYGYVVDSEESAKAMCIAESQSIKRKKYMRGRYDEC